MKNINELRYYVSDCLFYVLAKLKIETFGCSSNQKTHHFQKMDLSFVVKIWFWQILKALRQPNLFEECCKSFLEDPYCLPSMPFSIQQKHSEENIFYDFFNYRLQNSLASSLYVVQYQSIFLIYFAFQICGMYFLSLIVQLARYMIKKGKDTLLLLIWNLCLILQELIAWKYSSIYLWG